MWSKFLDSPNTSVEADPCSAYDHDSSDASFFCVPRRCQPRISSLLNIHLFYIYSRSLHAARITLLGQFPAACFVAGRPGHLDRHINVVISTFQCTRQSLLKNLFGSRLKDDHCGAFFGRLQDTRRPGLPDARANDAFQN